MKPIQPNYLFFVTADAVQRCAVSPAGEPMNFTRFPRLPGQAADQALAEAFAGLRRGARILLFNADAWCQMLELSAAQLTGLSPEDLAAILSFEAEAFSGLPAQNARTAFSMERGNGAVIPCRIMQMAATEVAAWENAIRKARLKLMGISHPAFLPGMDVEADAEDAAAAYETAQAQGHPIPYIPPTVAPSLLSLRWQSALLLAGGVLLACVAFHLAFGFYVKRQETAVAELTRLQRESERLVRQAQEWEQKTKTLRAEHEAERDRQNKILELRTALPELFAAVAEQCPPGVMIQHINPMGPFGVALEGLSATREEIDVYWVALAKQLQPRGWRVTPRQMRAGNLLEDGGPWSFQGEITREDAVEK